MIVGALVLAGALLHFEPTPDGNAYIARMSASRVVLSRRGADFGGVKLGLAGTSPVGVDKLPSVSNYFIGRARRSNVEQFARVRYAGVYPGIDVVFHGDQRRIEYDFEVSAHADASRIALAFAAPGALEPDGGLRVGTLHFAAPLASQSGHAVDVRYAIVGGKVRFRLGAYDHSQPLLIDPTLVFSTYYGGSDGETVNGMAVDSAGNTYISGTATSTDITLLGGVQKQCNTSAGRGCQDAYVAKFSPSGALVYSTYLGGSANETAGGIAVDSTGAAYVTGQTYSNDFPVLNAVQSTKSGGVNVPAIFVTKLNPAGSALIYSTYLGGFSNTIGIGSDYGMNITVDAAGKAYVVGITTSPGFPLVNAIQPVFDNSMFASDCFISVLNPSGSALLFSTYFGGNNLEQATGVAVDAAGNIYVAGRTASPNFPILNAYQSTLRGTYDGFVAKISPTFKLVYSTFIGGSGTDGVSTIAVDATGAVYMVGGTSSADFPLLNAAQTTPNTSFGEGFVAKLAPSGTSLVFSTYLGGTRSTAADGIALDAAGNIWITGGTNSMDFPLLNPFQATKGGVAPTLFGDNAFLTKYSPAGQVLYSTYFGSNYDDGAGGVAVAPNGDVVIAGNTRSIDFPVDNAFQPTNHGQFVVASVPPQSAFITRFTDAAAPCVYSLVPAKKTFLGIGEDSDLRVNANGSTCSWTASDSDSWISITSGGSATGIANVLFTVAPNNTLAARSTTLTVGGQSIQLAQAAATHAIATSSASALPGGIARIPISLVADPANTYAGVSLTYSAAGIASSLTFQPLPNLPLPVVAPGSVSWPVTQFPGFTGTSPLGELLVPIPASATAGQTFTVQLGGTAEVSAFTAPETMPATSATVTVGNPVPAIAYITPSSAAPGNSVTVTINGEGFIAQSTAQWNGSARSTTFKSETQLQVSLTAADLAAIGTGKITVTNSAPNGATSSAAVFSITTSPAPSVPAAGIVNGASFTATLAGNTIASIFGTNLASSTATAISVPLPVSLANVSVLVDGTPAPLFYVSASQINFQVPSRLLNQTQTSIAVMNGGLISASATVSVSPVAPAIFTLNSQGTGQGAIELGNSGTFAAPGTPAAIGGVISIFCAGLGASSAQTYEVADGVASSFPVNVAGKTTVTIGGLNATVSYAGNAPGYVGLYQVNATIPAGITLGNAVPVVVSVNGVASNIATIAVQ